MGYVFPMMMLVCLCGQPTQRAKTLNFGRDKCPWHLVATPSFMIGTRVSFLIILNQKNLWSTLIYQFEHLGHPTIHVLAKILPKPKMRIHKISDTYSHISNKFSLFQFKRMEEVAKKVAPGKMNHKNAIKCCQIVLFNSKTATGWLTFSTVAC